MTLPFEIVDEEYIEELKGNSGKENTKKSTENILTGLFSKVKRMKETSSKFRGDESNALDQTLPQFYAVRNSVFMPSMLLTSNSNGSSYN